jgi:hypothetical protein
MAAADPGFIAGRGQTPRNDAVSHHDVHRTDCLREGQNSSPSCTATVSARII